MVKASGRAVRLAGVVVAEAATAAARARGLLGLDLLDPDKGLWISPCRQVHTFGMRFPIDVAFLDRDGIALHVIAQMRPGRMSRWVWRSHGALEVAAGVLESHGVVAGDVVEWDR